MIKKWRRACRLAKVLGVALGLLSGMGTTCAHGDSLKRVEKEVGLYLPVGPNNPRNSEGSFVQLTDGGLLFVYSHYVGEKPDDFAEAYLASRRSTDGGRTWSSEDKIEVINEGKYNTMSTSMLRLLDGRVALFYHVTHSPKETYPFVRFSDDDGKTWSSPTCCIPDPMTYNDVCNDRFMQQADGTILFAFGRYEHIGPNEYDYAPIPRLFCGGSRDGGVTWEVFAEIPNPEGIACYEPGLVPLADGRLLLWARTNSGSQFFSDSSDGGETWSRVRPSVLTAPSSPANIRRIPGSDRLLAFWNRSPSERNPMNVAILSPDAEKIEHEMIFERRGDGNERYFSYPSFCFVENGAAVVVGYCCGPLPMGTTELKIARFESTQLFDNETDSVTGP